MDHTAKPTLNSSDIVTVKIGKLFKMETLQSFAGCTGIAGENPAFCAFTSDLHRPFRGLYITYDGNYKPPYNEMMEGSERMRKQSNDCSGNECLFLKYGEGALPGTVLGRNIYSRKNTWFDKISLVYNWKVAVSFSVPQIEQGSAILYPLHLSH